MSQLQVTGEAKVRDIQGPVVANSGVITALDGDASQYVRGDGTLADFPTSTGGGSSVSYYLNSSVSQGTIGGVAYRQLGKTPIIGAGTDITISANGYVASYITDANDPALLEVPAGNFNCEFYFSVNSNAHNPFVYAEVYKYDGTTFSLIGTSVGVPEYLSNGTTLSPYYFAIPVSQTVLTITDRISIRIYVNVDGRTVTLHTENGHLCQVVTTFSKGLTSLNNLTRQVQFLATGTSGTDFNISSTTATHTFNIPDASATNRGLITTGSQTIAGIKSFDNGIKAESGVLLKNGILSSSNGYTALNGNIGNLTISSSISGTPYDNELAFTPSTSNTYTFPNASGTIALTSNLSAYVPYTGATTNVDLGLNGLTANNVFGETSLNVKILASGSIFSSGYSTLSSLAGKFTIAQQPIAGTLKAFTFDFSAWSTSFSNTYILPDLSGTLALLEGAQTFSGAKTFSAATKLDGSLLLKDAATISTTSGYGALTFVKSSAQSSLYLTSDTGFTSALNFVNTNSYNYAFPAASGTIALTSNLSSYVPYSGATTNVDLGSNYITSATIVFWKGTGSGLGNIGIGRIVPLGQNTTGQVNIGIGENALFYNTTGSNNIALGGSANGNNTTGSSNIGIGSSANFANITGSNNIAIGVGALRNNTTDYNVAIGHLSSYFNTTGSQNVSLGYTALYTNTTGSINTAIGHSTLYSNTTGSQNTALGGGALFFNTTGSNNTGIGNLALQQNTTGVNNTAIGSFSHYSNTTGQNNTAIGSSSLAFNTTGYQNTAIGSASLNANTTAFNNTAIGNAALNSNTTGTNNTALGNNAGSAITTGSNNTIIGSYAGTAAMSNNIILADGAGNIRYQWNGTNNVFGNPISGTSATFSGNVGIGVTLSAWDASFRALQISGGFAAMGNASAGYIFGNAYFDGDSRYFSTAPSARIDVGNGMVFRVAASGTAGTIIPYTAALTLSSTGAATFSSSIDVATTARFHSSSNWMQFQQNVLTSQNTDGAHIRSVVSADSAPTYSWTGDTDTGMYTPSANTIAFTTGGGERMRITSAGDITIRTGQINSLTLAGGTQSMYLNFQGNGAIYAGSSYTVLYAGSDRRIKTDIVNSQSTLNKILNLTPRTFKYKDRPEFTNYGFIAQEVEEIMPELVRTSEGITMCGEEEIENQKSIESYGLAWASILVKAIQEQQQQIQELKAEIDILKNK